MSSSNVRKTDGEKMRNFKFRNCVLPVSLLAITAAANMANLGCSTGSGSSTGAAGTTGSGAAGTTGSGAAGTTGSGAAGTTGSGAAGTTGSGAAGTTGSGAAGTTGSGAAGTTGSGTAGATDAGTTGAAGTVGSTGAGGDMLPTTGVCAGAGTRALTIAQGKVDDFEADPILPGWSSFNNLLPAAPENSIMIMRAAGGADGTAFAGHYMGTGAKTPVMGGFGVGTIYNMAIDTTAMIYCVDISAFDGLTFWAKAGTTALPSAKIGVNFVIPSTNQAPQGDCPMSSTTCFNHPQKQITLTTDWQQYSVAFSAAMGGTGAKVGSVIQELGWLSPDSTWDFWLDEIQLYKGTPPTTPVGGNSTM
jgi:hypothetical protein